MAGKLTTSNPSKLKSASVNELREQYSLRKIRSGYMKCLKCGKRFMSVDKVANRLCYLCQVANESLDDWDVSCGSRVKARGKK
jgi:hypothetical protein